MLRSSKSLPHLRRPMVEMGALDEQSWASGLVVTAFGVRLGIRVDDEALLPLVMERLPPGSIPARGDVVDALFSVRSGGSDDGSRRLFYRVNGNQDLLIGTSDRALAMTALESGLRLTVASDSNDWVFVHAGAVGWQGRGVVLPAPSTHGKSTLVEALVRAGARYYSDEFAVLDRKGRLQPFAKPLSLRTAAGPARRVTAPDLGGADGAVPLPVALVVSTRYEPGVSWQPRVGSAAEAVLVLLANTVRARRTPADTMKILTRAAQGARLLEGPRPDAAVTVEALLRQIDAAPTVI